MRAVTVQLEGPLEGENRLVEPSLNAAPEDGTGPGHWLKLGGRDLSGWLNIAKDGSTLMQKTMPGGMHSLPETQMTHIACKYELSGGRTSLTTISSTRVTGHWLMDGP